MASDVGLVDTDGCSSSVDTVSDSAPFFLQLSSNGSGPDSGSYFSLSTVSVDEDPQLVHPDPKYECLVCVENNCSHRLLRDAVQTSCGHRMCRTCVDVYLGSELSRICPAGEDDCEIVTRDNIIPDLGYRREIRQLLVYCFYRSKGCKHKMKLGFLEKHKAECEFRDVPCTHRHRGCGQTIQFRNLQKHSSNCGYRPFNCKQCGLEINFNSREEHNMKVCPETTVTCPYGCEIQNLKRCQLEEHQNACSKKPQECKFKDLGCTTMCIKEDLEKHEQDFSFHFLVLFQFLTKIISCVQNQQKEIEEITKQEKIRDNLISKINTDLRLKLVHQVERIITLEQKGDELAQTIASLRQEVGHLHQSVEHLKPLLQQVANNERQLASQSIRLAEMDLRFQMLETASYDGLLLWKISDFNKRKRDAVNGRTLSLYSQPFYTSKYGYKMCGRVYLNGDGIGRGTHLSLYFAIMKGDYDALLPWPFQCKVTLMLLDQSPQKRHMKDEFIPDRTSLSAYNRPRNTEINPASGCPLFVAHSVLENPNNHYVKDDCIFIKIMIDTTTLQTV